MEIGTVRQVGIVEEMREAYLDYAMSVITARALPDVRDGLKPVQRRILYAMEDMGVRHTQPHKKSARIVGEVLGKYHPHGDVAVYDAMVRMAQEFSLRYPLVDGHGNFGSVDGDSAAAMRYTEARLAAIAAEILVDIDKDTVDFADNFDGTMKEPRVLPARLPNLLINGGGGIAVGMATNIPPHNLAEVCEAISFLIDRYDRLDDITVEDLMHFVKGPDFPTGGSILGREGITSAYATGKGRVIVRARAHIEDLRGGRAAIVVTELPFQVNKANLVERIADLVRNRRIETISDLRDESDRTGMRIVIELKRGADTETTLNQLLKYTTMQTTFGVNMLALVDGEPRVLPLKRILHLFVEHRLDVIRRRTEHDLAKAQQRAHILEGLKIALDNLDEVINLIRRSRDAETALRGLMRRFKLSEVQARAILDMQLRRLAALERRKIEEELAEVRKQIAYLEDLLAHPKKILALIQQEVADLREKYGDARRTRITDEKNATFSAEDLIPSEDVYVVLTQRGSIRRTSRRSYRAQVRGGSVTNDEDPPAHVVAANSMDSILFFTDRGRVALEKVHQVPDESRQARGAPLGNLISTENGETVIGVLAVSDFEQPEYALLVTAQGKIKRSLLNEFGTARSSPIVAISIDDGDALRWVGRSVGGREVMLGTAQGKAIRFSEEDVRPTGRTAGGVNAMRLGDGDEVASADLVRPDGQVLVVTQKGQAKRSPLDEYSSQARGGSGVLTLDGPRLNQSGPLVALWVLPADEEVLFASASGAVHKAAVKDIAEAARAGRPSRLMKLKSGDRLVAVVPLTGTDDGPSSGPQPKSAPEPEPKEPPKKRSRSTTRPAATKTARASKAKAAEDTDEKPKAKRSRAKKATDEPASEAKPKTRRARATKASEKESASKAGTRRSKATKDAAEPEAGGTASPRTRRTAKGGAGEKTTTRRAGSTKARKQSAKKPT